MSSEILRLAIDIGGTFTDTVLADGSNRILAANKILTTHSDPGHGALEGALRAVGDAGRSLGDVTGLVHGTTLATNALIEKRGANVVSVTTDGFRDILEIAYERRYAQYDIGIEKPDLLIRRTHALTVTERMDVHGRVLVPLEKDAADSVLAQVDALGADAIAICLLHAYANPAHEVALRDAINAKRPDLRVSISSDVSPEAREFDRLCTTLANAYIQPLMDSYLARFEAAFDTAGLVCPVLMMTAAGGMCTLDMARRFPIRLVESGPAGGAILAADLARQAGLDQVLSFDMGGTTAKLCLIDGGQPQTTRSFEVARAARFIKGSGMPVRIPVIDMIEIGAGGGSVAHVDTLGRLGVGPESAGSDPGPVGFGRGGTRPTVTDADLAQGLIRPEGFAQGDFVPDAEAARDAIATVIGSVLSEAPDAAARGVSRIVDENMAAAARMHAVEAGKDIAARTMIAFGGNGPLHATRVARAAGVKRIVIPRDPGVGSAVGFLFAPVAFERVRSLYSVLSAMDLQAVGAVLDAMEQDAREVVSQGAPGRAVQVTRAAFMRYAGQGHEIEIALPEGPPQDSWVSDLTARFEQAYSAQFSRPVPGMNIEILNWAVRVAVPGQGGTERTDTAMGRQPTTARILCDLRGDWVTAQVVDRASLTAGETITGPALITEPQTTTLVSSDFTAQCTEDGALHLTRIPQEDMA